jgi:hypothetical protein
LSAWCRSAQRESERTKVVHLSRRSLVVSAAAAVMPGTSATALAQMAQPTINPDDYHALTDEDMLWLREDANAFRGQLIAFDCEGSGRGDAKKYGFDLQDVDGAYRSFMAVTHIVASGEKLLPFMAYLVTATKTGLATHGARSIRVHGVAVGTYVLAQPIMGVSVFPVIEVHHIEPVKVQ